MKILEPYTQPAQKHPYFFWALRLIFLVTAGILALEFIAYAGFVQNKLHISTALLPLLPLVLFLILGRSTQSAFPFRFQKSFIWITTAVFGVLFFAVLLDYFAHSNFVYSTTYVHTDGLIGFGVFWALASYTLVPRSLLRQQLRWLVFLTPFWIFAWIFPHRWIDPDAWMVLVREDGPIEYLTMVAYLLASIVAAISAWRVSRLSAAKIGSAALRSTLLVMLVLFALASFLIAGDEISWGQRILGIQTPENLAEINTQQEINWHNNRAVYSRIYEVYNLVAFSGLTAWIPRTLLERFAPKHFVTRLASFLLPPQELALFFLPSYLFTLLRTEPVHPEIILWEETSELFLGAGFMMTATWIWLRVRALAKFG